MNIRREIYYEAITWLKTPWRHEARVKGAGVDCAQFLIAVYSAIGLVPAIETGHYAQDWHLHRDETLFLDMLLKYAEPCDHAKPGDIAMFQYGRHPAHGAIVLDYPQIIHAWKDEGAVCITYLDHSPLLQRLTGFYRLKGIDKWVE